MKRTVPTVLSRAAGHAGLTHAVGISMPSGPFSLGVDGSDRGSGYLRELSHGVCSRAPKLQVSVPTSTASVPNNLIHSGK